MIQHINLLSRPSRKKSLEWLVVSAVVLALLALAGFAGMTELRLQRLSETETKTQQSIADLKAALEKKRREVGFNDSQVMAQQSAALRSQIDARRDWSDLMQKGELGTPWGHSQLLEILASLHQDGIWLQGMEVSKGGQSISITGKSMSTEAVMRYIAQVNEAFKPMNIQFSSMEITQEAGATDAAAKAGALKFKLY